MIGSATDMKMANEATIKNEQFFIEKATETKDKIIKKVKEILETDRALSPKAFAERHITEQGRKGLAELDQRAQKLFKVVLCDVVAELGQNLKFIQGLFMISVANGDMTTHGNILKHTAVPFVQELIQELDARDPEILIKAASLSIDNQRLQLLSMFKIDC